MGKLIILLAVVSFAMADWEFPPEYQRTPLGNDIDVATFKLLKTAFEEADKKNVVSSPLGLMTLLSIFNNGAGPESQVEINKFLGAADVKTAKENYQQLSNELASLSPEYFTLANKIYLQNSFSLNDAFASTAREYKSEVDTIDFSDVNAAAKIINQWSNEKTNGTIKEPVSPDALEGAVSMLCNVIYFKGHWSVPFKVEHTKEKDFHVSKDAKVKKPMMHLLQSLYYTDSPELGAKMIELPYKEKGFRMVVVLPNEVDGLQSVLEKVATKGLLTDVFKLSPAGVDVDLDMPKFEIKSKLDFNSILPKLGVSKLFEEPAGGIVKDGSVKVSKAFQEAVIKVDEEGSTASAFTGLVMVEISMSSEPPRPIKFTVDHPFLYAILYEDKMIFAGTYTQ